MPEEIFIVLVVATVFIGFPWLIFHYSIKWKAAATLTGADEKLLDDLHEMARRLDDRLCTIERIMNAENPDWRQTCLPDEGVPLSTDLPRARIRRGEER